MKPSGWTLAPKITPTPVPIEAEARVSPAALRSFNHIAGTVTGQVYHAPDINTLAWWDGANLDEPVRVELAEGTGRLFADAKINLTYYPSLPLNPGSSYYINTAFKPESEYKFTPLKLDRELNGLHTITGETVMGRMARTYPKANILEVGPFTAREAIMKLFDAWRSEGYTWLEVGAFPSLYLKGSNGRYYEPTLQAMTVLYDEENPRSMQDILAEFLDSFPGYNLRADRANRVQLVAPSWVPLHIVDLTAAGRWSSFLDLEHGVDVSGTVVDGNTEQSFNLHLDLEEDVQVPAGGTVLELAYGPDRTLTATLSGSGSASFEVRRPLAFLAATEEEDRSESTDTSRIVNRATVRVEQAYEYVADQTILEPAYFKVWGYGVYCFPKFGEFAHPTDDELGNPTERDMGTFHVKDYIDDQASCPFDVTSWVHVGMIPAQQGTIIGGDRIKVSVTVVWWRDQCGDLSGPEHLGDSVYTDLDVYINASGISHLIVQAPTSGVCGGTCCGGHLVLGLLPVVSSGVFKGLYVYWAGRLYDKRMGFQPPLGDGNNILGVGVFISAIGERWQPSENTVIGQWGYNLSSDEKATPGLSESQATFGIRERTHRIRTYKLDADVVQDVARALCELQLNPIKVYRIEQFPPYKFGPSDLMSMVALHTGEVGYLTDWSYSESHTPGAAITSSSITVEVFDNLEAENIERTDWDGLAWDYGRWLT